MKFGKYLETNKEADWAEFYIDYSNLKKTLKAILKVGVLSPDTGRHTSLSSKLAQSSTDGLSYDTFR